MEAERVLSGVWFLSLPRMSVTAICVFERNSGLCFFKKWLSYSIARTLRLFSVRDVCSKQRGGLDAASFPALGLQSLA